MTTDLTKRVTAIAAAAALVFGAVACNGDIDVEEDPGEEAPLEGTEDPVKETPAPDGS